MTVRWFWVLAGVVAVSFVGPVPTEAATWHYSPERCSMFSADFWVSIGFESEAPEHGICQEEVVSNSKEPGTCLYESVFYSGTETYLFSCVFGGSWGSVDTDGDGVVNAADPEYLNAEEAGYQDESTLVAVLTAGIYLVAAFAGIQASNALF